MDFVGNDVWMEPCVGACMRACVRECPQLISINQHLSRLSDMFKKLDTRRTNKEECYKKGAEEQRT